jgi:hypothetical protein
MKVKALVWIFIVVVVIVAVMAIFFLTCTDRSERLDAQLTPPSLFGLYNDDEVQHEVNITIFSVNGTQNNTQVCSETFWVEAGGKEKSSFKNDDGGEYLFEISIDEGAPQEFTFSLGRSTSLAISILTKHEIETSTMIRNSMLEGDSMLSFM